MPTIAAAAPIESPPRAEPCSVVSIAPWPMPRSRLSVTSAGLASPRSATCWSLLLHPNPRNSHDTLLRIAAAVRAPGPHPEAPPGGCDVFRRARAPHVVDELRNVVERGRRGPHRTALRRRRRVHARGLPDSVGQTGGARRVRRSVCEHP